MISVNRMNKILVIFLMSFAVAQCGIPFVYTEADPHDPVNVAKVREALMHVGLSPDGIKLISFLEKYEVLRIAYKATYLNKQSQECFIKWRVGEIFGTQTPQMPICENVAIGQGSDPLRVKVPPVIVYPTQGPVIYQPTQIPVIRYQPTQRPICWPTCTRRYPIASGSRSVNAQNQKNSVASQLSKTTAGNSLWQPRNNKQKSDMYKKRHNIYATHFLIRKEKATTRTRNG